jgi:hypothetical protein
MAINTLLLLLATSTNLISTAYEMLPPTQIEDEKAEDRRLEQKREDQKIQDQKLEDQRQEQKIQDQKLEDQRQEQKRLDRQREDREWDRAHGH